MSKTFTALNPATGQSVGESIPEHSFEEVSAAIKAADKIKDKFAATSPAQRAALLNAIADSIEAKKDELAQISNLETALPIPRVTGEVMRTVIQIRAFADLVKTGGHLLPIIDLADPNYQPVARPDLRKSQQPLGVVSIFAASNFPLAFSVAGGDSASALAAGCPVVVKAHPSHPNTCQMVYHAVVKAITEQGLPKEIFTLVQGVNPEITHWLAKAPEVSAIGFTGSGMVGKLLIKLAQERPIPIPVYAEMGSLNPVFFTPAVLAEKSEELAKAALESALLGSGQFCTKPGIIVVPNDAAGDKFIASVQSYIADQKVPPLLNKGIASRFTDAISLISKAKSIKVLTGTTNSDGFGVTPTIFVVDWAEVKNHDALLEEHFGPTSVIIRAPYDQFLTIAKSMSGQLASAIHATAADNVKELVTALTQKAGRLIWNGFPTSVSVTAAQNHGGQWPASSSHTTSVGLDALFRFVRPVVYQNFPDHQLPAELQNANPYGIERVVNGVRSNKQIN
ncbi:MAG: aldehyde dehydrogenase (NADP(+)) [Actinobacteria bacterium]|nr:aldehyde dehydrogenase (NADP(+)) [Actinomycetota bacterium]